MPPWEIDAYFAAAGAACAQVPFRVTAAKEGVHASQRSCDLAHKGDPFSKLNTLGLEKP